MAPTFSMMDRTKSYTAFSHLSGPSEMPNRRFDVINQMGADEGLNAAY